MKLRIQVVGRNSGGSATLPAELELTPNATLSDACAALQAAELPPSTLVVVSGRHVGTLANYPPLALRDNDELLFLAPIAGG
jgi:hypothetical protein